MKRIFVYSHGFGVKRDDRGLFTDIAAVFSDDEHVMFDYNEVDEVRNELTISPLPEQVRRLNSTLNQIQHEHDKAEINLICHSQGCVVAALASPRGIRQTVFVTPPSSLSVDRMIKIFGSRKGAVINLDGMSEFSRRDGSTTIVPRQYWQSIHDVKPISLYKSFTALTELHMISANQDEILKTVDFTGLTSDAHVVAIDGNHDFTGDNRQNLLNAIETIFTHSL
jgi:hypothetical protein